MAARVDGARAASKLLTTRRHVPDRHAMNREKSTGKRSAQRGEAERSRRN
jgi:hypothetical protein